MKKTGLCMAGGIGSFIVFAGISVAATTNDSITVSATVSPYCEIFNPLQDIQVDYNPYDLISVDVGTLNFGCVKGTNFTITAVSLNNPEGDKGILRKVDNPSDQITYQLSATVNYGSVSASQSNLFATGLSMTAPTMNPPVAFYVAISFGGQPAPTGIYTDTVTINISY
ncbi:spore coat protein U domain-containing protein [Persephonella sp.]